MGGDRIVQVCNLEAAWQREANAEHIALHDPARVLRDVAACRRVMARHIQDYSGCYWCSDKAGTWLVVWPCPDLLDLASIYSDRPGHDPAWAPPNG